MAKDASDTATNKKLYKSVVIKLLIIAFIDVLTVNLRQDAGQTIYASGYLDLIVSPFILAGVIALVIHARRIYARRTDWPRITALTLNITLGICIFDLLLAMMYYGIHTK